MRIRTESPADATDIRPVVDTACRIVARAEGSETALVGVVRATGSLTLSRVARVESRPLSEGAVAWHPACGTGAA